MIFTKRDVKRQTYLLTTGQFHERFGKKMEEEKAEEERGRSTKKQQQQLDFKAVTGPREFTRAGVLHAVARLIATNDQVSVCMIL